MAAPATKRTRFEHAEPILCVSDMAVSVGYYTRALGFVNAEWGTNDFTFLSRDGAGIYLCRGAQGHPGTWAWVGVEDVETLYREYLRSGACIRRPPRNYPWALELHIEDPDGHVLRFGSEPITSAPFDPWIE
jgi:predicted enzyme related to lactoylglutathione lyase